MADAHDFTCPSGFEHEIVKLNDDQSQIPADLEEENIELWMIKAPLNFNISLLSGHELEEQFNIPLEKKSDIEFLVKATEDHPMCKAFQTVIPHETKNKLKIGPSFKGYVDIVQSVKINKSDCIDLPQRIPCQIPSSLKQRYVPYGAFSPLKDSSTQKSKEKSKKRKRTSESLSFSNLDASQVSQVDTEEQPSKKKRKKHAEKKELNESLMHVDIMDTISSPMPQTPVSFSMLDLEASQLNQVDLESSSKKKKKKHRDKKEFSESCTSVDMMDNSCLMPETPVSFSMPDLDASLLNQTDLTSSSKKKKKKHREKKEFSESRTSVDMMDDSCLMSETPVSLSMPGLDASLLNQTDLTSSSKKKKHKEKKEFSESRTSVDMMDDSCLMPEIPVLDLDASQLNQAHLEKSSSKKKKHKEKKEFNESLMSVDIMNTNSSPMPQTPVFFPMPDLDASLLNQTDLTSSSKKKKKKHRDKKEFSESCTSVDMMDNSCLMPETPVSFSMPDLDASLLNQTDLTSSSKKKKQKHREKKEFGESRTSVDMMDDSCLMPETPVSLSMPDLDASLLNQTDLTSSSKKKKKKHREKKEFSESHTSVDMMDDSCLMPQTPVSFSMLDLDASQLSQIDLDDSSLKNKKHKEKKELRKSGTSVDIMDTNSSPMPQTPVPDLDASQLNHVDLEKSSSKKKKHKEKKELNESLMSVDIMNTKSSHMPQTPVSFSMPGLDASLLNQTDLTSSSKKKKKKHREKKEFSESHTSVDMMDDSCLMPQTPVSFSMLDLDASQLSQIDLDESSLKKKKHKEKKELCKSGTSVDIMDTNSSPMPQTPVPDLDASQLNHVDLEKSSSKKKKHKEKKESNESLMSVDIMNTKSSHMPQTPELTLPESSYIDAHDESLTMSGKKKKKKKKHKDEENNDDDNNTNNNSWNDSANLGSSSKKKKSKKDDLSKMFEDSVPVMNGYSVYTDEESVRKDGGIISLQMEFGILNSVDSVQEKSVSSHKKKKKHKQMTCLDNSLEET